MVSALFVFLNISDLSLLKKSVRLTVILHLIFSMDKNMYWKLSADWQTPQSKESV